jgi:APA family basic amino acid/polyamine antiporter
MASVSSGEDRGAASSPPTAFRLGEDSERVFIRQATGLTRSMGTRDALLYNTMITTILLGAALSFLWVPYAFPGANLWLGILITGVLGCAMMAVYSMLASAMPRSGGDYVFQSRLLHPAVGVGLILSGFVIWLAFWESLGGWLLSTMALSPFALVLGDRTGAGWLTDFGTWAATPWGITIISLAAFVLAIWVLVKGTRYYTKIQGVLWACVLLSFLVTWILLLGHSNADFRQAFNGFVGDGAHRDYYAYIIDSAHKAGYQKGGFSLLDTFGVAPILWTALAWAAWSVVTGGELKNARRLNSMLGSTIGAMALNTLLIGFTAILLVHVIGSTFLGSLGYLYFTGDPALNSLAAPPFFGILASTLTSSPVVIILLGLGFLATGVQILIGMAWGGSRLILALAFDRMLPPALGDVSPRFHTPVKAIAAFFALGVMWVFLYNHTKVANYTLAVTLASILVYMGTMLAGMLLPYRAKEIYKASPAAKYTFLGLPLITVLGFIAFAFNGVMAYYFVTKDELGVNDPDSLLLVGGILVLCVVYYYARRAWLQRDGYEPDLAFAVVPPE